MVFLIGIAAFFSTLLGGLFALHLKDRLHLILGFSAGAVLGVTFFDLLPEALELGGAHFGISTILSVVSAGFVSYLLLDRVLFFHGGVECPRQDQQKSVATAAEGMRMAQPTEGHHECSSHRGVLGAGSLSLHSFIDGLGVGLAFKVSPAVGIIVAIAVLAHGFSDGINTVNMILKSKGGRKQAFRWLFADALAPLLGVCSAYLFEVSGEWLGFLLALFSGSFLYIGASDLLPESHHAHPVKWTTVMTVLGIGAMFVIIRLAAV